jgi:hypothetical protein
MRENVLQQMTELLHMLLFFNAGQKCDDGFECSHLHSPVLVREPLVDH